MGKSNILFVSLIVLYQQIYPPKNENPAIKAKIPNHPMWLVRFCDKIDPRIPPNI